MSVSKRRHYLLAVVAVFSLGVLGWLVVSPPSFLSGDAALSDPEDVGYEPLRLLTPAQYRYAIQDIFGPTIEVQGSVVTASVREEGLLAVGASQVSLSSAGFEMADEIGRKIAGQVVAERNRAEMVQCRPELDSAFDQICAQQFIQRVGRLLYRRPLTGTEQRRLLEVMSIATEQAEDFYAGLEKGLSHMLVSPHFLMRMEAVEPDPVNRGEYRLSGYAKASRLSFLLWDSTPDAPLLAAAERGELHDSDGLAQQVDRMLDSPRLERGVRAFFSDLLMFERFDMLTKDLTLYPKFGFQTAQDVREQTLRLLVDHLLTRRGDYRELFTTRRTFLTPTLASLLAIPLVQPTANAEPDRWQPYQYPEDDPRAGLLAQPAFVALHAYPGRTSPTLRGKALRENLLCQEVPLPPDDVDFSLVQTTDHAELKTMRQRLQAHATNPTCAGCHKITDPIGLALENFDATGGFRRRENGVPIDTRGTMDGVPFEDAAGLGQALRGNPSVISCLVNRVYAYGVGREVSHTERKWLKEVREDFAEEGHQLPALLRNIATSHEFYRGEAPAAAQVAAVSANATALAAN